VREGVLLGLLVISSVIAPSGVATSAPLGDHGSNSTSSSASTTVVVDSATTASSDFAAERTLILQQTNVIRATHGLPPLRISTALHALAQDWSVQQARANVMSHRAGFASYYPSGWTRAAENVAAGYRASSVVDAWFASPGHRANLLGSYTHIGIGVAVSSSGRLYYTQNFGQFSTQVAELPIVAPDGHAFYDVPPAHQFAREIEWLASSGISTGYANFTFLPSAAVTRDAMAAFLYRFAGSPDVLSSTTSAFLDVSPSTQFFREMTWLSEANISTGYPDRTFRPLLPVSREAMAAFLYRSAGEPPVDLPAASPFSDVGTDHAFYTEIVWLATTGVSTGYPDTTFRPLAPVSREAMAAFLYRFDQLP
jgi:uncharacterized protein YkwD